MKPSDVPMPRDDVLFRKLDDGCVLYDPGAGKVHSLNATAALIWCLIDGERPLEAIAAEVCARSNGDAETVLADVLRAADTFARQGLLQ